MEPAKDQAIKLIRSLPSDCSLEDIQYHLYVCEKIQHGIKAIDEGRTCSQKEAEKRVEEWLTWQSKYSHLS